MATCSSVSPAGSREVAWAITEACSGDTVPSDRASVVTGSRSWRSVASLTARAAAAPPERVCCESHAPVDEHPASSATLALSAAATSSSSSACSLERARASSAIVAAY